MALGRFAINYGSSTGFGGGFGIFDAIKGTFGLSDPSGISMARARDTDNPYVAPRTILSTVANAAAQQAQAALLGQSTRPNQTPVSQPVSQTFAATGPGKLEPLVQEGTQTMSLDLGNLLGNLGSQYISARWGTQQAPTPIMPGPLYGNQPIVAQGPRAGIAPTPALAGPNLMDLGQQGYDYFFGDSTVPKNMTIDPVTGRLCKKQRRRRKRLATTSDIKDLAALKSVLSPADLKTWIATHPS
ncbi:MAG: hypothetical protein GY712_00525 [Oceanicoccus sp.]|uniref:hypothetical protein n=1 Tax=Oceanicoccus sp. TaxID=2691044 RepID=UPI002620FC94|nr:hypothetical protein [Oceanicoccus sp.]MCP3906491.1 hypothetical protein [Oceanicoccus sp.]